MRILVIGSTGQLARALAALGPGAGHDIIRAGRPQIDLERPTGLADLFASARADAVINAAAYTAVDAAEDDVARAEAVNATAPASLARTAEALSLPFIHVSTDYVFDGTKGALYTEDDPVSPLNMYGRTKAAGEAGVLAAHTGALVVRTSWVYAPEGKNFVRTMLGLAEKHPRLRVVDDQIGRPTEASALAQSLMSLAESLRSGAPGGRLHVANAGSASWRDFAEAALRGAGKDNPVDGINTEEAMRTLGLRAPRPADTRLDLTRADQDYGVRLPDWRESLERCLAAMGAGGRGG
ncbi:dTDP-4-dehydrorhamnose reductase [Hyphobacterium marinum]|uniref:dTDP-4-dehydrorhamnose reductase n=1 Tax=Hyphobacterium marinum TaxID=3116574 RepID=A0ABU7M1L5_9PROT|nr:dTDP-4-dehydrorhamnose reductase [Hyphobacterium sp. Y6023]MEE2567665.1 dTDP-4-dehydrorhamnose reductase [Hyphobacterium sp. Y6023]